MAVLLPGWLQACSARRLLAALACLFCLLTSRWAAFCAWTLIDEGTAGQLQVA